MLILSKKSCLLLLLALALSSGCSSNQTMKNAWKSTKGVWYTYASPKADIDYEDTGSLDSEQVALATRMMGIDVQLAQLERVMINADKPPTGEWLGEFFTRFPWVSGFAGVRADGQILGQEPSLPLKPLDYAPLLEEDKKQGMRDLRGHVQDTPLGPEVFLATPLYDGSNFLGVVIAHFDMRSLLPFSTKPEELVILSPEAVLWSGKFDIAATPLSNVKWAELIKGTSSGSLSNATGAFQWVVRYFGNQPLIFAVPVTGTFPEKSEQAAAQEGRQGAVSPFTAPNLMRPFDHSTDLQQGSTDSMLLEQEIRPPSPFGPSSVDEQPLD